MPAWPNAGIAWIIAKNTRLESAERALVSAKCAVAQLAREPQVFPFIRSERMRQFCVGPTGRQNASMMSPVACLGLPGVRRRGQMPLMAPNPASAWSMHRCSNVMSPSSSRQEMKSFSVSRAPLPNADASWLNVRPWSSRRAIRRSSSIRLFHCLRFSPRVVQTSEPGPLGRQPWIRLLQVSRFG